MAGKEEIEDIIVCEKCFEENEITRKKCKKCGAKLIGNSEIDEIEEDDEEEEDIYYTKNSTAVAVKLIGKIEIACAIIAGLILGGAYKTGFKGTDYNVGLMIGIIVGRIIIGTFILGFGEIIQKLQNIEDNTNR